MIYGNFDVGPAHASGGRTGFNPGRILQEVAIKAKADTKAAASEATVNAIKKLSNQKTPGAATIPNVTPSSSDMLGKFKALPDWVKWTAYAFGAIAVVKMVSPGRD